MEIRKTDRRQESIPVEADRRIGLDRRELPKTSSVFSALEVIPTFRRTATIQDKIDNGDYIPALGALGLTMVNWEEDLRDLKSAGKQIYSKINKNYHYDPLYDRHNYQHSFSFTRGVIGEKYLHQKMNEGNKIAQQIYSMNRTLDDTKFGKFINKIFKTKKTDFKLLDSIKDEGGICASAVKYESKILGGEMTARAMRRTTIAGFVFISLLEATKVIRALFKGDSLSEHVKNGSIQTVKSTTNVISTTAGIGYGGAIGAKYGGATGSLIGMGLGAILGNKLSTKVQNVIS